MAQTHGVVGGRGYDPAFLGIEVATPTPGGKIVGDVLVWEDGTPLPYTHFSLTMSASRRLTFWGAWNIDGGTLKRLSRAKLDFAKDSRIPATAQVGN